MTLNSCCIEPFTQIVVGASLSEKAALRSEIDSPLGAAWSAADPATRAVLDLVAEILAQEYVARMKATTQESGVRSNESGDLRTV